MVLGWKKTLHLTITLQALSQSALCKDEGTVSSIGWPSTIGRAFLLCSLGIGPPRAQLAVCSAEGEWTSEAMLAPCSPKDPPRPL